MNMKQQAAEYKKFERYMTGDAYDRAIDRMEWWHRFERKHGTEKTRDLYFEVYGEDRN